MSFTWDWLLTNLISYGLLDYYQCNIALNHNDVMLYRMGRGFGPMVTEVHIIKRQSGSTYRIMSFDFDTVHCVTCKNAQEVCEYIVKDYVPLEFRKVSSSEYLKRMRDRRAQRAAARGVDEKSSSLSGEFDWEIVQIRDEANAKIETLRWQRINKEREGQK